MMVQRIETGETGRGVPDVYLRGPKREMWVELKNDRFSSVLDYKWRIDWRAGQQAWAYEYRKHSGSHSFTAVCFKNGCILIPMIKVFNDKIVTNDCVAGFESVSALCNDILREMV
jgi:hypothetical protein